MENSDEDPGFMSVIFNKTENKDGTLNFIALGYNAKNSGGNAKIACTYYKNVDTADFKEANFGRSGTDCKEIFAGDWFYSNITPDDEGKLNVGFVITAQEGDTPYKVGIYGNKTAEQLDGIKDGTILADAEKEFIITNEVLGRTETGKIDAGIGFYASVYEGKTLKGEWQVADITFNPDGIIWEDEIPNTLNIQLAE